MSTDSKLSLIQRLRGTGMPSLSDVVNHPFSFAAGVGIANGALAAVRNKKIDMPTAAALAAILGLGEMALEAFTPPEQRHHSLLAIAGFSVLGVAIGLAPFITLKNEERELFKGLPIASIKNPLRDNERIGYDY